MTKKIYLKSPVKLIRSILILLGVVVVTMFVAMSPSYSKITPQYELITVAQGDTLWSIAREYKPEGTDLRTFVYELADNNGLSDCSIVCGQSIFVPVISE